MTFDPTKPVQTNEHPPRLVRIVSAKCGYGHPIAVMIERDGVDYYHTFRADGTSGHTNLCLVNVPEREERWMNVYKCSSSYSHATRISADYARDKENCTGVIRLTIENNRLVRADVEEL